MPSILPSVYLPRVRASSTSSFMAYGKSASHTTASADTMRPSTTTPHARPSSTTMRSTG